MKWTAAGSLALGAVAAFAGRGAAEPCTSGTAPLAAEVALRAHFVKYPTDAAERAEKRTLARVARLLALPSRTYSKDSRDLGLAGAALLALYPGDGAMGSLVQGAMDGLRDDVLLDRDDLDLTAGELSAGKPRDRADEGVAGADAGLADEGAADPLDVPARSAALEAAAKAIEKGFRGALQGSDRRVHGACGDMVWVEQGGQLLWKADRVSAAYDSGGHQFLLSATRARRPAEDSELDLVANGFFGSGSGSLDFGTGKWRDGDLTYFDVVESGTLTVTNIDLAAGTAEGTFSLTSRGCLFRCATKDVTGGRFRIRHLKTF